MVSSPKVFCGPAGWSYPHWDGVVFPASKPRGFHPLEYLARFADLVEIDSSSERFLRPEIARLWLKQVSHNPRFQFTARLHHRFTDQRELGAPAAAAFKEGLWPLLKAGRLGCLLMQFPWSFRFTAENREFLIQLRRAFHEFPLAAQMRHDSWVTEEALGTLIDYRIGFVNIDQPRHTRAMPPTAYLTNSIGYVRMHGRNRLYWLEEFENPASRVYRGDYLYGREELDQWKARIEKVSAFSAATFVVFANEARGAAVVNTLEMDSLLGLSRAEAPAQLARCYPERLARYSTDGPVQNSLFPLESAPPLVRAVA